MKRLLSVDKVRPGRGFSHAFHLSFIAILPIVLFVLARLEFNVLALIVLLLSKWRMFALHPRHWIAHLRTNAVDIIVGISFLIFLIDTDSMSIQLMWVALFEVWLLLIKPQSSMAFISLQAIIAQGLGLSSLFFVFEDAPIAVIVLTFWAVAYFSARHFFNAFDETRGRLLSSIWAFFAAALAWILSHWLLFIGPIAQPALLVTVMAYGLAGMYYLDKTDRLSALVRRQIALTMFAIIFVVIILSDWGDKAL